MRIFIDDERDPPEGEWLVFRDMITFMQYLDEEMAKETYMLPEFISFDHDLGEYQPTGFDIAKKLVEIDMDGLMEFIPNFQWTVHSQNPVGKENINELLKCYLNFKNAYYECDE